ncbi:MAG: SUMF1/EgtB/PvdO family nonheme iron enzyme, partial [Bacteroidota bacterium]
MCNLYLKKGFILAFLIGLLSSCNDTPVEKNGMVLVKGNEELEDFWMDVSPVTVAQFSEFVEKTHFKTQAEKFGNAGVFDFKTGDWNLVEGATWKYPFGKNEPK